MNMERLTALILALAAGTAPLRAGGNFDNPLAEQLRAGKISAAKSAEIPACFNQRDRQIRWNNVFRTNQPCPAYAVWRTGSTETPAEKHQLKLVFNTPCPPGTILFFASDNTPSAFSIQPGRSSGTSAVATDFDQPVGEITATASKLSPQVVQNWGSRKDAPAQIVSYSLQLLGIYGLNERRENIARFAECQTSTAQPAKQEDAPRVGAGALNDGNTWTYFRSAPLKPGEPALIRCRFPQPATIREIALYIGERHFGDMPSRVEVEADGRKLGTFDTFNAHPHLGRHFYLLSNPEPERKMTELTLKTYPGTGKKQLFITELVLLAAPGENHFAAQTAQDFQRVFTLPATDAEFASARLERPDGSVVRNLEPVNAKDGKFTFRWDGTGDDGKVAAPGEYRLRGVTARKFRAEFESCPYSPAATPWVTPSRTGGWLSDHTAPEAIEPFGDSIWVGAPFAESGDTIMELDRDGNKRWGVRWLNLAGAGFLRALDGKLFVASGGGWVGGKAVVSELDPVTKQFKTLLTRPFPAPYNTKKSFRERILTGFAPSAEFLALAYEKLNKIELFDRKGKFLRDLPLDAPGALRFLPSGKLLAVSGKRLLELDPATGNATPRIAAGLTAPRDFSLTPAGGFLVCDAGDNRVKEFDADGKQSRAWGTGKGHKAGKFDPRNLEAPNAALLTADGKLWIAESGVCPKRMTVRNAADNRILHDFLGPARYEAGSWFDPADVNTFYAEGMTFRYNPAKRRWDLASIYQDLDNPAYRTLLANRMTPERPLRVHGKLWLARDRHWGAPVGWFGEVMHDGRLRPQAAVGQGKIVGKPDKTVFLWNDLNRNGRMDADEIAVQPGEYSVLEWNCRLGDDLAFYFLRNRRDVCRIQPAWNAAGYPVYDWNRLQVLHTLPANTRIVAIAPLPGDKVLLNTLPELTAIDAATGKKLWSYPNPHPSNRHDSPLPRPGEIQHTLNIEGVVNLPGFGDIFCLNANKGLRHIFRTDGLYCGSIFADQRIAPPLAFDHPKPGDDLAGYSLMDEAFCGVLERNADGVIRFSGGKNHHTVSRVRNLESLREFTQDCAFSADEAKRAAESVAARRDRERRATLREPIAITRIDGARPDWRKIRETVFADGGKTLFRAKLAMNATDFFGEFRVEDDSPFANRGNDPKLLFKTGDSINLEFGNHRKGDAADGDFRLLIAPFNGDIIGMVYDYRVSGFSGTPVEFTSPVGKVTVDRLRKLDGAEYRVERQGGRYRLTFRIPLADLPCLAKTPLYGDIGVIFSDRSGSTNQYNAFYNSAAKGITADVPSEIRLLPREWQPISYAFRNEIL